MNDLLDTAIAAHGGLDRWSRVVAPEVDPIPDGIIVPTNRRIYAYTGNYQLVPEPLLVSIDIHTVALKARA